MKYAKNSDNVKFVPDSTNDKWYLFAAVIQPGKLQDWEVAD